MKKSNLLILAFATFLLLLFVYYKQQQRNRKLLVTNGVLTTAKFIDYFQPVTAGQSGLRFIYYVRERRYHAMAYYHVSDNYVEYVGRQVPVIYQKDDPDNNRILLTKPDFAQFGLPFPDSLAWIDSMLQ
ncbi:DUF3592 domain-containing protein [Pedobacter sp. KR3-3]|uniref:DUF3592 domain-containing protein n=1 Tax=Pedobacter albus TaxID=3113905 RepID=A0ABU7IAN0_9SPHI|nr:DUF3592 domain-containing protein [Pedobacter sp. KR3-3]MEE1946416.1 DUF3592 domain-containing protein [Pedobacter sp. KR3-3]